MIDCGIVSQIGHERVSCATFFGYEGHRLVGSIAPDVVHRHRGTSPSHPPGDLPADARTRPGDQRHLAGVVDLDAHPRVALAVPESDPYGVAVGSALEKGHGLVNLIDAEHLAPIAGRWGTPRCSRWPPPSLMDGGGGAAAPLDSEALVHNEIGDQLHWGTGS